MAKKILITGGNGFVGRQICRIANQHGIRVISISRSGQPAAVANEVLDLVDWYKADVFDTASWQDQLTGCDAVIHCVGIIEEEPQLGLTFERMILNSAQVAGRAAEQAGVGRFVYLSAGASPPETPVAYMDNKRAAEDFLSTLSFALTILRPGLIYGADNPETLAENAHFQQLLNDPQIGPHLRPNRPLSVESVAMVALMAAWEDIGTILDVDAIEQIAAEKYDR